MFYLLAVTYATILLAELIGDKNFYTISSLAMRFRPIQVFCGLVAAFSVKMLVAVLVDQAIAELPKPIVAITTALTFFVTAILIWFKKNEKEQVERENNFGRAALIAFFAIALSEWGDIGQIMAATLTAKYGAPLMVWIGATLAMITKGLLAMLIGNGLRQRIPTHILRVASASICLILGVVSALEPLLG